jgi:hypothetical protein
MVYIVASAWSKGVHGEIYQINYYKYMCARKSISHSGMTNSCSSERIMQTDGSN